MTEPTKETQRLTPEMIQPTRDNLVPQEGFLIFLPKEEALKINSELSHTLEALMINPHNIDNRLYYLKLISRIGDYSSLITYQLIQHLAGNQLTPEQQLTEAKFIEDLLRNAIVAAVRQIKYKGYSFNDHQKLLKEFEEQQKKVTELKEQLQQK
jgi:hypothetical protein